MTDKADKTQQNPTQNTFDPFSTGQVPVVGSRIPEGESFRGQGQQGQPEQQANTGGSQASVDLSQLIARVTENDAPRWMVVKDKLDHGPFSGRELVQMIMQGEIKKQHGLTNMDTGMRAPLGDWREFQEFVTQAEYKQRKNDESVAIAQSEQSEKTSNFVKATAAAAIVVVLVGSGLVIWLTRSDEVEEEQAEASVADLYERGEIDISGSAGILPAVRGRGKRGRSGSSGGGAGSYEDAMNKAVSLGDATGSGSMRQLTSGQVASVMNRNVGKLSSCVSKELRSGSSLGTVSIDIAIEGSGRVLGASVRQGSGSFKSCVQSKVRSVRFPSFPAPRMGARYSFQVGK